MAQQQHGRDKEKPRRFRLAIAETLLEGDAGHRRKKRSHEPHRHWVGGDMLDDGLVLRQWLSALMRCYTQARD